MDFNKEDILNILEKFDLKSVDRYGENSSISIIVYNKIENLGFDKKDILNILEKFDLT